MNNTSFTTKQAPPQARGDFVVSEFKAFEKNTLRGFFTVTMPSGMIVHGCSLHEKNGARWIGMPSNKFTTKEGTTSYTPIVEFVSREAADRFRDQVLVALDKSREAAA
jgi:DNA-binding cell septation regulator SpoVG